MNIEELVNKTYIVKVTPNLPVKAYMIIKNCGMFKFIGKSDLDNMDMFTINKVTKRMIKIDKILNTNNEKLKIVNTTLKNNIDNLIIQEITFQDVIHELNQI